MYLSSVHSSQYIIDQSPFLSFLSVVCSVVSGHSLSSLLASILFVSLPDEGLRRSELPKPSYVPFCHSHADFPSFFRRLYLRPSGLTRATPLRYNETLVPRLSMASIRQTSNMLLPFVQTAMASLDSIFPDFQGRAVTLPLESFVPLEL